jgi:signal transduction histidine kinase
MIANLGPPLFRANEVNGLPALLPAPEETRRPAMAGLARFTVLGLGVAGVLPPLAFTARPGDLGFIGAVPVSVVLTGILILAPALAGLVAALFGLEGVRDSFRARGDKEHEQAVLRIFGAALAVAYALLFAGSPIYADVAAPSEIIAALGLAGAWVFLVLTILDPEPSALRHYLGSIYDAALLSAFLHYGAALSAPWFPLYLLAMFYAGYRFGFASLCVAGLASLAGFVAVIATTAFWQQQELLAGGLCVALIALSAFIGAMVREVARSREAAAVARAARTSFLAAISQALRAPLDAIVGEDSEPDTATALPAARALLSQLHNILDYSAIEAGALQPAVGAFDLHHLVNETLADRRAEALAHGQKLQVHIDPALPYQLRGCHQQLAQIIDNLAARSIETSGRSLARIAISAARSDNETVDLRLSVWDESFSGPLSGDRAATAALADETLSAPGAFRLALVRRLVELMGGGIEIESSGGTGRRCLTITAPFAIDGPAADSTLDLGRCLVLIATDDSQFASEIAEPLNAWHSDPRWIEGFNGTLGFVDGRAGACSVLIVDGRTHVVAALSFAHRAATGAAPPSFILIIAEPAQVEGFIELADGEVNAVLAAPFDAQLLANALHSLPLSRGAAPRPVLVQQDAYEPASEIEMAPIYEAPPMDADAPQVTPISAHPRFTAETPVVDPKTIAALRGLDGYAFLGEVIDSFRSESEDIMQRLVRAAAMADAAGFARGLQALRSCAANLGGLRLCEAIASLRECGTGELRQQGSTLVQRLDDEVARLDAALIQFLPARGERQSG